MSELAKNGAKSRTNKGSELHIPHLRDCRHHIGDGALGLKSSLFITIDKKLNNSIVMARDAETQAVFTFKHMPLNVCGKERDKVFEYNGYFNLERALGTVKRHGNLRYKRVIITTGTSPSDLHSRNCLLSFFVMFHENLIRSGQLFIFDTPRFLVVDKKFTFHFFSYGELKMKHGQFPEAVVKRILGFSEIPVGQLANLLRQETRLIDVKLEGKETEARSVEFFMGSNTLERKQFIKENLI